MCFTLIAYFFLFYSFFMNTQTTKCQFHKSILIHIIFGTGLNSHSVVVAVIVDFDSCICLFVCLFDLTDLTYTRLSWSLSIWAVRVLQRALPNVTWVILIIFFCIQTYVPTSIVWDFINLKIKWNTQQIVISFWT